MSFIAEQSDYDSLIAGLSKHLQQITEAESCSIALFDQKNNQYSLRKLFESSTNTASFEDATFSVNEGPAAGIFNHQQTFDDSPYLSSKADNGSLLHVALQTNDNTIGCLIFGFLKSTPCNKNKIISLVTITAHLSLAIDRIQQKIISEETAKALQNEINARKHGAEALKYVVEGVGAEIGNTFFRSVVEHLAHAVGTHYALVGEITNNGNSIETIAVWRGNRLIDNFTYNIQGATGSACNDKICYCCHSATKLLPDAEMQKIMRVKSCWALPINNSTEETIGVLVVMHNNPIEQDENIIPIMKIFASRSGPEIERIRTEAILFNEKERAQVTLGSIGDGVITTNANGKIDYLNQVAEDITGWNNKNAQGLELKKVFNIIDESTRKQLIDSSEIFKDEYSEDTSQESHILLVRKNGEEIPIANTISAINDREGTVIGSVIVFSDISHMRDLVNKITYQASHDELTGLINRRKFETLLNSLIEASKTNHKQHALCYIDLDRFKDVNDTCGHMAGDELLKEVSSILFDCIRDNDAAARIGGDEFGVLLQGCPVNEAHKIAEKIRKRIKAFRFLWGENKFEIGASIGVMAINSESGDISQVLNAADAACYIAKGKGRNCVYTYHQNDLVIAQHHGDMRWATRLKEALENDKFSLYVQKISHLSNDNDKNEHYEILIRLIEDDGEVIPPMAFIPAAERYNLMPAIDTWVIQKVFSSIHDKNSLSQPITKQYAINLSGQSMGDKKILNLIIVLTTDLNINPNNICFEITETAAIKNINQARNFMRKLKKLGFCFSLDDFGSGLSSFAYLKNLPIDYLKIDGEFIKNIANDKVDYTMVDAITRIGHEMGIKIIAEFVEDEITLSKLCEIGVDFAQGYGIEKPKPLNLNHDTKIVIQKSANSKS